METLVAFFRDQLDGVGPFGRSADEASYLERFIQIGTSEMYGSVDHATKEDEPIKPTSPYAASKAAFDMYLIAVQSSSSSR